MIESAINIAFYITTSITVLILVLPSQYDPRSSSEQEPSKPKTTVQILVLGDIGRSPRMQYHAMSIAKRGGRVDVIGYHGARNPWASTIYLADGHQNLIPILMCPPIREYP